MTSLGKWMLNRMAAVGRGLIGPIGDGIKLPEAVKAQLRTQFQLSPETMAGLECVGQDGSYGGQRVGLLRIFDKVAARQQGLEIKSYGDLDGHQHLVHFLGKKFKDGALALFPVVA